MENSNQSSHYAVLIDADNVSSDYAEGIFEEISKYGMPTIKRVYGNWKTTSSKWEDKIKDLALTPIQQFAYTKGKNAIDMALVIDAMDILYSNRVSGICIVSSDSDYIPLSNRLKEQGLHVIGMGERKTPKPFLNSCNKFIYLENIYLEYESEETASSDTKHRQKQDFLVEKNIVSLIVKIVEEHSGDDGWLKLSGLGLLLSQQRPDFDVRTYGYNKLSTLITNDKSLKQELALERDQEMNFCVKHKR